MKVWKPLKHFNFLNNSIIESAHKQKNPTWKGYLNPNWENNSERPVDALAENGKLLTDLLTTSNQEMLAHLKTKIEYPECKKKFTQMT